VKLLSWRLAAGCNPPGDRVRVEWYWSCGAWRRESNPPGDIGRDSGISGAMAPGGSGLTARRWLLCLSVLRRLTPPGTCPPPGSLEAVVPSGMYPPLGDFAVVSPSYWTL